MQSIHARYALTLQGWQKDVTVVIENGQISGINNRLDASGVHVDILLPAPVNLHSHSFQRAMSGLTEERGQQGQDSFWTWRQLMYQFLEHLTPDHVGAIAEFVFMEMLEAGFAAVAEFHYLHHDATGQPYTNLSEMAEQITRAATNSGIGLTLLPVLYMQGGCDGRNLMGGQRRFGCDLDLFEKLWAQSAAGITNSPSDFRIGVAPHSLRAVPPHALAQVQNISRSGPIHMHLAEQTNEVSEVSAHLGARPAQWLLDNTPVDERWCLIHCTQMTDQETIQLAQSGAIAGLCPITESSLGDGIFNGRNFLHAGGQFGIGSDSNIHIALWHELATLEYSQRLRDQSRASLAMPDRSTGRVLFETATNAGAQAAARHSGRIETGNWADLIALSSDNEILCHCENDQILDSLIFSGRGHTCVSDVWTAGRHMVTAGRHKNRDHIVKAYRNVLEHLKRRI